MMFEYDPHKSQSNKLKHGLDFDEAQALWDDDKLAIAPAPSRGEARWTAIGHIDGAVWTAIFTMRGDVVRLISCRRARRNEVALYEQKAYHH